MAFEKVFFAAETGGFSVPITSIQVPLRVESLVLFPAAFLILAPRAEHALNRMQIAWGRHLLAFQTGPHIKWLLVVAQCGWIMRLGTRMVERAILTRARIFLLPSEHAAHRMLRLAVDKQAPSWATCVKALMVDPRFSSPLPEVTSVLGMNPSILAEARRDKLVRKKILSDYKWQVVRPVLLDYDQRAFVQASTTLLPASVCRFLLSCLSYAGYPWICSDKIRALHCGRVIGCGLLCVFQANGRCPSLGGLCYLCCLRLVPCIHSQVFRLTTLFVIAVLWHRAFMTYVVILVYHFLRLQGRLSSRHYSGMMLQQRLAWHTVVTSMPRLVGLSRLEWACFHR